VGWLGAVVCLTTLFSFVYLLRSFISVVLIEVREVKMVMKFTGEP
jgi:hypothetical protein